MDFIDEKTGFQVHTNEPEPPKQLSLREGLLEHASRKPGGITDQDIAEIDQIAPESKEVTQFGAVSGGRMPTPTGDILDIKDHADWLARKEEILKDAFPNDRRYQYR